MDNNSETMLPIFTKINDNKFNSFNDDNILKTPNKKENDYFFSD